MSCFFYHKSITYWSIIIMSTHEWYVCLQENQSFHIVSGRRCPVLTALEKTASCTIRIRSGKHYSAEYEYSIRPTIRGRSEYEANIRYSPTSAHHFWPENNTWRHGFAVSHGFATFCVHCLISCCLTLLLSLAICAQLEQHLHDSLSSHNNYYHHNYQPHTTS